MKLTLSGATPLVGAAAKFATGAPGGGLTVIRFVRVSVSEPPGPVTVRLTEYVPAA